MSCFVIIGLTIALVIAIFVAIEFRLERNAVEATLTNWIQTARKAKREWQDRCPGVEPEVGKELWSLLEAFEKEIEKSDRAV